MSRLRAVPYRKLVRALNRLGFRAVRQRGSHVIFAHADGRVTVVPDHRSDDIGPGLVKKVCKDIGIEFEDLEGHL